MPEYKTIQDYLDTLEAQIRWKRARPVISAELRLHMEDQRDAFQKDGHPPEEAEHLAVEEMGDPVTAGAELDLIHRPKPQWGLLTLTAAMALTGGCLRIWLTAGSSFPVSPVKTALALLLGTAALLGGYFLDCSRLTSRSGTVYAAALAAGALLLLISPRQNYIAYYAQYAVQTYPVVYAVWLCGCRGKGWWGFLPALAGGVPLAAVCMLIPSASNLIMLLLTGFVLLAYAVWANWFQISRYFAAAVMAASALLVGTGMFWYIGQNRFKIALHPELDPWNRGYQGVAVRNALSASQWLGTGSADFAPLPYEKYVPEWNQGFFLTTVVYKLGWLPFLLLAAAGMVLLLWMLAKCLRQSSQTGRLLTASVLLILFYQMAVSVVMNMGVILFIADFPLLVGNLETVLNMGLIGLALSAFRGNSILREGQSSRIAA